MLWGVKCDLDTLVRLLLSSAFLSGGCRLCEGTPARDSETAAAGLRAREERQLSLPSLHPRAAHSGCGPGHGGKVLRLSWWSRWAGDERVCSLETVNRAEFLPSVLQARRVWSPCCQTVNWLWRMLETRAASSATRTATLWPCHMITSPTSWRSARGSREPVSFDFCNKPTKIIPLPNFQEKILLKKQHFLTLLNMYYPFHLGFCLINDYDHFSKVIFLKEIIL